LLTFVMIGCGDDGSGTSEVYNGPSSGNDNEEVNTPELYGVGVAMPAKPAGPVMMTSSLYKIDAGTGAAMLIGNIGYDVNGIAYDSNKKKLFGIATNMNVEADVKSSALLVNIGGPSAGSQLIEINMSSGEGKSIGEIKVPAEQIDKYVDENTSWNGSYISTVGAAKSDFYAQSFYADVDRITKFGVMIGEAFPEGQVLLAIVPANSLGKPDLLNPLYEGDLINPSSSLTWYYEENIDVPVNKGQKYFILIDGYNNPGATGNSRIGSSNSRTDTGESMFYTNDNGSTWGQTGAIAVYIEGLHDHHSFGSPTFNSRGDLYAWNYTDSSLCEINLYNATAKCGNVDSDFASMDQGGLVLSFDNKNLLYILEGLKIFTLGKYDDEKKFQGMLPDNFFGVYNGDFHPLTGQFWGLYSQNGGKQSVKGPVREDGPEEGKPGNLLIIDIHERLLMDALTVPDNINAITWVYNPLEEYKE